MKARAREYYRSDPTYPHHLQSIVRRSEDWITLYDASAPIVRGEPEPELVFDAYDFLRPCSRFPQSYILDRKISIPLGELRRELVLSLQARQNLPGYHSVPKAGSLTRGFSTSQGLHGRKGQLSNITTCLNQMSFRRSLFTSATSSLLGNSSARFRTATRSSLTLRRPTSQGAPKMTAIPFLSGLFTPHRPIRAVPLLARFLVSGAAPRILIHSTPH